MPTPFSSRCDLRPSPALFSQPRHARSTHHTTAPPHTPLRTHDTHARTSPCTRAPRHKSAGKTTHPAINIVTNLFEPRDTNPPKVCPPALPAATHAARAPRSFRSALPLTGAHDAGAHARTHARTRAVRSRACTNYVPAERRAGLRATQLVLAISTCERAASPVLLTTCALLPRCRQPQLRAVGLDGHRALDISATTGGHNVDTKVTMIRGRRHVRALPLVPGGAKPVLVSRARSSSRLRPRRRTARPAHHRVQRRRLRPYDYRHGRHNKHHRGLVGA